MMKNSNQNLSQENHDWAYDKYFIKSLWLRRSMLINLFLFLLLAGSISSNLILLPLKEKVPFLYAFDHASGEITKVGELEPSQFSSNWELTRYLIIHYIINYESYDFNNLDVPYQLVFAQSDEKVKREYEEKVKSDNKQSPYQLYGKDKFISARIISINKLNDNTVDVKFEKTLHDRTANTTHTLQREAILKWNFEKAETTQKMLDRDPLGFKVTYYQTSQVNLENEEIK